jgi:hypothetical protein
MFFLPNGLSFLFFCCALFLFTYIIGSAILLAIVDAKICLVKYAEISIVQYVWMDIE